jgi:hypothetical protein
VIKERREKLFLPIPIFPHSFPLWVGLSFLKMIPFDENMIIEHVTIWKYESLGFLKREFVDVWAFMSFLWKMIILTILVWNVVDSCYKLYSYVCYTYICIKLSSLCFWKLKFEIWRVFPSKPENKACLSRRARCSEWLLAVANKHVLHEHECLS